MVFLLLESFLDVLERFKDHYWKVRVERVFIVRAVSRRGRNTVKTLHNYVVIDVSIDKTTSISSKRHPFDLFSA